MARLIVRGDEVEPVVEAWLEPSGDQHVLRIHVRLNEYEHLVGYIRVTTGEKGSVVTVAPVDRGGVKLGELSEWTRASSSKSC